MKRMLFLIFAGMAMVAMAGGDIWTQATAQIAGTVKDQTGAVLPGVEVKSHPPDGRLLNEYLWGGYLI